jgi:hypothetical protein
MHVPHWATSSFGDSATPSALETSTLAQHVQRCSVAHSRLPNTRCAIEWLQRLLAPRLMTSLLVVALIGGAASLAF